MRALAVLIAGLLLAGCIPTLGDDDDDDDGAPTCPEQDEWFAQGDPGRLDVPGPVDGDWSCRVGDPADPIAGAAGTVEARVLDFQDLSPLPGVDVAIWLDGSVDGEPDQELMSDNAGGVAFEGDTCSPVAARTSTSFQPPETYPALQPGLVPLPGDGSHELAEPLTSIAYSTYNLLPLTVGVEPIPGRSLVFGRVRDCAGQPVGAAEISLGTIDPDTGCAEEIQDASIRYLLDGDPDGDQQWTDDDGGFLALNVFPQEGLELLAWGRPGDEAWCLSGPSGAPTWSGRNPELCLVGRAPLPLEADAATVLDVRARPLPPDCY